MEDYLPILLGAGAGLGGLLMYIGLMRIKNGEAEGDKRRGLVTMNIGLVLFGAAMFGLTRN